MASHSVARHGNAIMICVTVDQMSHKFKPPKPMGKSVKQMPLPLPKVRVGLPRIDTERTHEVIGKLV